MKPLLHIVVTICLVVSTTAHPEHIEDVKQLPQTKEPVVEAEEGQNHPRIERCSACSAKLNINSPNFAALQTGEVHTTQSFEGCSTETGCAGVKVKDGKVVEKFGDLDAFRNAAASDVSNEYQFHAASNLKNVFEKGIPSDGPFWWMNQNSPFKTGGFQKYTSKSTAYTSSNGGLADNIFLNGDFSKGSSFQSSNTNSFSASNVNSGSLSQNPFLNGQISNSGYTGSSPKPFSASTAGSNINLIQTSQKEYSQGSIDDVFANSGNVLPNEDARDLQQTCAGQGYVCVPKSQCNNGVVNTNAGFVPRPGSQKQYCNLRSEICCRLETANFGSTSFGSNTVTGFQANSDFGSSIDTQSAGSGILEAYRPGAVGSKLKPGIPYLPPVDSSNSASNIVSSTPFPTPTFVTTQRPFSPRPTTPGYLPPPTSTSAPGYLPPERQESTNTKETYVPPSPNYTSGGIILDQFRPGSSSPRPTPPPQAPNEIPAGCAAALKCTPIEYCTAEGVISNTTVVLTRDQESYRVPLTDCKDLGTGRIGKCCRDPYYTDPWPVNQLGKWVPGVFGGNDGKYVPDSRGSSSENTRPVTGRPPVTGSLYLNVASTPLTPLRTPVTTPGPNYQSTPSSGAYTQVGQGSYFQGGRGQYAVGGEGSYTQQGVGQFGIGGVGVQRVVGAGQVGIGQQGTFGVGQQTTVGGGQRATFGVGQQTTVGVGQQGIVGVGQQAIGGRGEIITGGAGAQDSVGQGSFGTAVSQAPFGVGAQGTYEQGFGVVKGQGKQVTTGSGQIGVVGQGTLVTQGAGVGATYDQAFNNQGYGTNAFASRGYGQSGSAFGQSGSNFGQNGFANRVNPRPQPPVNTIPFGVGPNQVRPPARPLPRPALRPASKPVLRPLAPVAPVAPVTPRPFIPRPVQPITPRPVARPVPRPTVTPRPFPVTPRPVTIAPRPLSTPRPTAIPPRPAPRPTVPRPIPVAPQPVPIPRPIPVPRPVPVAPRPVPIAPRPVIIPAPRPTPQQPRPVQRPIIPQPRPQLPRPVPQPIPARPVSAPVPRPVVPAMPTVNTGYSQTDRESSFGFGQGSGFNNQASDTGFPTNQGFDDASSFGQVDTQNGFGQDFGQAAFDANAGTQDYGTGQVDSTVGVGTAQDFGDQGVQGAGFDASQADFGYQDSSFGAAGQGFGSSVDNQGAVDVSGRGYGDQGATDLASLGGFDQDAFGVQSGADASTAGNFGNEVFTGDLANQGFGANGGFGVQDGSVAAGYDAQGGLSGTGFDAGASSAGVGFDAQGASAGDFGVQAGADGFGAQGGAAAGFSGQGASSGAGFGAQGAGAGGFNSLGGAAGPYAGQGRAGVAGFGGGANTGFGAQGGSAGGFGSQAGGGFGQGAGLGGQSGAGFGNGGGQGFGNQGAGNFAQGGQFGARGNGFKRFARLVQGEVTKYGQGFYQRQGTGQEVIQGIGTGVKTGQGLQYSTGGGFGVENEALESIHRVFLQRYNGGGQCGLLNPQKPYGNKNELEVDFAEIPWQAMVLLQTNKSLLCGGVITRPDVVITSASCVDGLEAKNVLIKGGEWKLGIDDEPLPFQIVQVKHILRHPFYKQGTFQYDAAILVLTENLRLAKNIAPICLPSKDSNLDAFYNGAGECLVTGWGKSVLQSHLQGSIMHALNVSLLNPGECQAKLTSDYPHLLEYYEPESCVCGQPSNPLNNICKVDIGSALACTTGDSQFVLRGIYSWDSGCQIGNQIAAFYRFDIEWYEWALGFIESVRFARFGIGTKVTQSKYTTKVTGVKTQYTTGVKGFGISGVGGVSGTGETNTGFGGTITSGVTKEISGGRVGFDSATGQSQFSQGQFASQFGKFGEANGDSNLGLNFGGEIKGPISNSYTATYTEKKVFQSEPKYITYTTKPEIVTFTTKPEYYTFTTKPKYFTYTTKPEIITYTTKPEIITFTTKPEIITYTTKPKLVTYTTKPQLITYETSGSGTNPQYVAPNVSLNPSFTEVVGHKHTGQCKCLENSGKK